MKRVFLLAAVAGVAALLSARANATTITTLPLMPATAGTLTGSRSVLSSGAFTDIFTFSLSTAVASTSAVLDSAYSTLAQEITNLTLSLYSGSPSSSTLVTSSPGNSVSTGPTTGFEYAGLRTGALAAGTYYLEATGTVAGSVLADVTGTASVSPVPLPAALPLFSAALIGAGVIGRRRRRHRPQVA